MHSSRMHTACSSTVPVGLHDRDPWTETPRQRPPEQRLPPKQRPPLVNRITDRCRNNTFPQLRLPAVKIYKKIVVILYQSTNADLHKVWKCPNPIFFTLMLFSHNLLVGATPEKPGTTPTRCHLGSIVICTDTPSRNVLTSGGKRL